MTDRPGPTGTDGRPGNPQWVEVHRLAVAGREPEIARNVGARVSDIWIRRSRFADVAALQNATLTLGPDADALYYLGWAQSATGHPQQALTNFQQALTIRREVGDRAGEAVTLTNIGAVYDNLGDRQQALTYYQQALPIHREVGDRAGEATTLNNIGAVHDGLGDRQQALTYYQHALPIRREVGDRAGEATTLNNIGGIRFQQRDFVGAKDAMDEVIQIWRDIGDRGSEALASFNMAVLLASMEQVDAAVEFQGRAIALAEQTRHPALDQMRAFLIQLDQTRRG